MSHIPLHSSCSTPLGSFANTRLHGECHSPESAFTADEWPHWPTTQRHSCEMSSWWVMVKSIGILSLGWGGMVSMPKRRDTAVHLTQSKLMVLGNGESYSVLGPSDFFDCISCCQPWTVGIILSAHVGSRCIWPKGIIFSRYFGWIEKSLQIPVCYLYVFWALHDNVTGVLGIGHRVCKGVELIQVSEEKKATEKNSDGFTEGRQREIGKNWGLSW